MAADVVLPRLSHAATGRLSHRQKGPDRPSEGCCIARLEARAGFPVQHGFAPPPWSDTITGRAMAEASAATRPKASGRVDGAITMSLAR
jgi:hypothetical protein